MHTDSVNLTDVAIKSGAAHSINTLNRAEWPPESFQHLVMHQTSRMTLNSASREINRLLKNRISRDDNTINNLEQRGNTASTAHFIAIADEIRNKKINTGDRVVFSISASGLTTGTALYIFDDLPDRLREGKSKKNIHQYESPPKLVSSVSNHVDNRIRIESVGTIPPEISSEKNSIELLKYAATNCLNNSSYVCDEVDLLIFAGIYRSEYILEPAFAALLAGELDMNATASADDNKKTLAFDIFNGSVGFLNACYVAQQMISAKSCNTAMVIAAEYENNSGKQSNGLMGIRETGSAFILDAASSGNKGFSRFLFNYDLESQDAYTTYYKTSEADSYLNIEKDKNLEELYINCILPAVQELMQVEGHDLNKIDIVFPPQISSKFISNLSKSLNLPLEKFVDVVGDGTDLFSSSLPYAFSYAYNKDIVKAGDIGLMISVGSGLQVGCAIYHF